MDFLPPELIEQVFRCLQPADLLNCALVSRQFSAIATRIFPELKTFKISLTDCPVRAGIDRISSSTAWIDICQCGNHGGPEILKNVLPFFAQDANSLEVEDDLVKGHITDQELSTLLAFCGKNELKRLALSRCDLMKVQPWTLALLARFEQLEKLEMEGCLFSVSESMLIRSLSTSFKTLTNIDMRNNKQITDKFARNISRNCPQLEFFRVSGCPLVSTFSVLSLIEATFYRVKQSLTIYIDGTPFNANQLNQYMCSPLFPASNDWRLVPAYVQIGYEKPAILAEHKEQRCVLIYV